MSKEVEFINGITIPRKLYNRIENLAVSLLIKHNIRNLPIDPFALAVLENFVLRPYSSLPGEAIKMLLINAQDGFSYYDPHANKTVICYDDSQCYSRQRFTVTHEIGHILMEHKHGSVLAEHIANHFAGYLLAPSPLINALNCEDCFDVKEKFQISDDCAYYRFNNYKNWLKYQIDKVYGRRLMKHFSSKKE